MVSSITPIRRYRPTDCTSGARSAAGGKPDVINECCAVPERQDGAASEQHGTSNTGRATRDEQHVANMRSPVGPPHLHDIPTYSRSVLKTISCESADRALKRNQRVGTRAKNHSALIKQLLSAHSFPLSNPERLLRLSEASFYGTKKLDAHGGSATEARLTWGDELSHSAASIKDS
jgi:hypothetical protein